MKAKIYQVTGQDLAPFVRKVINDLVESGVWSVEKANQQLEQVRIREAKLRRIGDGCDNN